MENDNSIKRISTTALAKIFGLTSKELFEKMLSVGLIYRKDDKWNLTAKGTSYGGVVQFSEKFGDFIVWPETLNPLEILPDSKYTLLNSTKIGEHFNISNQRVNNILYELGWIEKASKGWQITALGAKVGGITTSVISGGKMVIWAPNILENPFLIKAINPQNEPILNSVKPKVQEGNEKQINDNKYPETLLKTKDGHLVRSRAEMIIDNLLYEYGLTHAYERELTVAESVFSDFYIPARNGRRAIYIEFWGIKNNEKYNERKRIKQEIYKTNNLNLIEIEEKDLENLDSFLRRKLLQFDINVDAI